MGMRTKWLGGATRLARVSRWLGSNVFAVAALLVSVLSVYFTFFA